jgi:hypothetical protein
MMISFLFSMVYTTVAYEPSYAIDAYTRRLRPARRVEERALGPVEDNPRRGALF